MFDSGLSYIRADFHLHTRMDKEFKYEGDQNSFAKDYVAALKQANIRLGVITNHNKFDKDEYDAIRKVARKEDIFILPGVELTVKEGANGIHTLIVFDPEEWLTDGDNHIQTFLTTAFATISNPENKNTKCTLDLRNTLETLDSYGRDYFIVFAHVDQNSGLFAECKGGLLRSLSELPSFKKRVLGLQKAKTRDNIALFKNCFDYVPAIVEGSDPKSLDEIGKGKEQTILKIGEYSYSALKFALQDYENRIRTTMPKTNNGYIESISFQGGKFDGQTLAFSKGLNTLIGIRGSGKSALIEIVRYVFGLDPQADSEYKIMLVKNVMGSGGKASITVIDKHGKHYCVSRIYGERPTVVEENGNDLKITPQSIIDGIQYFGQKDLSNSADHEYGLLEKLVSGKVGLQTTVDDYVEELSASVGQMLNIEQIPTLIDEATVQQSEIDHKMSIFKEKGVAEKLEKQTTYTTDKTKLDEIKGKLDNIVLELRNAYNNNKSVSYVLTDYTSKYNEELVKSAARVLTSIDERLDSIGESIQELERSEDEFVEIIKKLSDQMTELSDEFAEIKREIKDESLDADTFVQLTADAEKVKNKIRDLKKRQQSKESIEAAFAKAARQRNEALQKTFQLYKREADRINSNQDELRIEIEFKGDRDGFKATIKNDFKGTGITDIKYQNISERFSDYVTIIEDWILRDGKELRTLLSPTEYGKLNEKLIEKYPELLKQQVQNKVNIYYHDKLLRHHSIGQRASALILFILTQDNNDIIMIDQPEDDLDSKVIYDEVISAIVKKKTNVQFIFATHNANIPVLGDAERIFVTDYEDTKIAVSSGNIDLRDTHKQIVDIMEGGQVAFERRQHIYEAWR